MNRIFRRVWNRQLNALVVASELASNDGGNASTIDQRHALLVPSALTLAVLCALIAGPARAETSQSLRDLQALAAKYTQAMPVKVDAEVALAAAARQAQASTAIDPSARVGLQLNTTQVPVLKDVLPAKVQVTLDAGARPQQVAAPGLVADVRATVGLGAGTAPAAAVDAGLGAQLGAGSAGNGALNAKVDASANVAAAPLPVAAAVAAKADVATVVGAASGASATVSSTVDSKLALAGNAIEGQGSVGATAAAKLAVKEETPADTHDVALAAGLDAGAAGKVRVQGPDGAEVVADRNLKLAGTAATAAQTQSLGLGTILNGVGSAVNNLGGAVGNLLNGNVNGAVNGIGNAVGGLVGGVVGGLGLSSPSAIPPGSPKAPAPADPNSGVIVGTGGLVGGLGQLLGPTTSALFGGDGYLKNGNTRVSNANVMQTYSVTSVLGIPVVNLSPVGNTLNGLGGATTGGSSHLTLIGGVTSDSYIYNINNGNPNGLLGLLLPNQSPAWAAKCLDIGLADISCWAVNAAQDYQVLMGDGAYANGSREVVIGANARHELPRVDANVAFPGNGTNDPSDPTGVPTADYAARMGHSVIVGDSAKGTANGQVLLGAEATSSKANSVALGFRSAAERGAQASYAAYGLNTPQVSAGEVSVGIAGAERQITNVAAGSSGTDAVNVAQLQGAISQIDDLAGAAVTYDLDGLGNPNYRRVTLGGGTGTTTLANLAAGAVNATSTEAVNGTQLFATNDALARFFGGRAAFDPATGAFTAPLFEISTISVDGAVASGLYDNATDAFDAVDGSLANLNTQITNIRNGGTKYLRINSNGAEAVASGLESIAVGSGATATAANSIAVGAGSVADRANTVSIGATGAERQVTHVAAGTATTDAVNLGQLQASEAGALRYDLNGDGSVNLASATLGAAGTPTALRNLAAGQVSAASSDAINGAQLFAANQTVATHLGGGASVDGNGVVLAPTYTLNNIGANGAVTTGDYRDVGSAFDAVSNSLANVADQTGEIDKLAVKYDADANGNASSRISLGGAAATAPVSIGNLAAGQVSATSSEAINGAQLFATHTTLSSYFGGSTAFNSTTGVWTPPTFRISSIATDGSILTNDYHDVTVAFSAVEGSLLNLNTRIDNGGNGGSPFLAVNSTKGPAVAGGSNAVALGPVASAGGAASVAIGDGANASADNSVALGAGSVASTGAQSGYTGAYGATGGSNSAGEVSVGSTGGERKVTHVADGSDRYDAVNVGQLQNGVNYAIDQSKAYTDQRITNINNGTSGMFQVNNTQNLADPSATGANSAAGGAGSKAAGANATALGNGASAQADNSVALGAGSVASRANTVSVGSAGAERAITNVADGTQATDAVNVRQLQASQQGTIRYDTNVNGTTNLNSVTLGSTSTGPTTVRNVAAGTAGTDAVNVDQLKSGMAQTLDWSKAYTDERFNGFDRDLRKTDNRASAGVASAMAVAALPQPTEAGRNMASIAAGSFNGESGVAVGISGVSEGGRWIYKFSGSTNSRGDGGVSVGAGIQW
ncbi:YadA-like family protein [Stenotrophomonas sp. 24(2023)]|uniref:YadA-like family protein n=1 Tax=Stenotrophomonas sp. 24(2023) TaxID=3068324 RepID=UPI0027E07F5E|nr:YadA-like family protein [Stenotrophomonas sp. 24(2023)]WMJ69486.1 YadA-like family protein [Stenotrophomonas sp. 24(2023)]